MTLTVPEDLASTRLDRFLGQHSSLSRREVREALAQGRVRVNDRVVRAPRQEVVAGDQVRIESADPGPVPTVVHSDEDLLVLAKPSGMPTQAPADRKDLDLYQWAQQTYGEVYLHHRLDRPASGLVLLGRTQRVNKALTEAFREHQIRRIYRAVLTGTLEREVRWTQPIEGKTAATRARPVGHSEGLTAVEIELETGRTHQIRRHAATNNKPLAGDRRYGADTARRWPRLALHAWRLELTHPITGEALAFETPVPEDLEALWNEAAGLGKS